MSGLRDLLESYIADGAVPGAVGLVGRGDQAEVEAAGAAAFGGAPMARDSIFRLASITKPVTAAAVMILVDTGPVRMAVWSSPTPPAGSGAIRRRSRPERADWPGPQATGTTLLA